MISRVDSAGLWPIIHHRLFDREERGVGIFLLVHGWLNLTCPKPSKVFLVGCWLAMDEATGLPVGVVLADQNYPARESDDLILGALGRTHFGLLPNVNIFVRPSFRGRGIGSALLDQAAQTLPCMSGYHTPESENLYTTAGVQDSYGLWDTLKEILGQPELFDCHEKKWDAIYELAIAWLSDYPDQSLPSIFKSLVAAQARTRNRVRRGGPCLSRGRLSTCPSS